MTYTIYHLHSHLSNGTTTLDSVTDYKQYIELAKNQGMKALAFSEHGNLFEWLHKKEAIEKAGMKYIHGVEAYVTESMAEQKRDNYHVGLYARNFEGFKELNRLVSKSFTRDGHFYYQPRVTIDELISTSNNIIVTTACLGGILSNGNDNIQAKFKKFLTKNATRCFLEIQHHNDKEQINYNQKLYGISKDTGVPLIAGTDTHAVDDLDLETRLILQKRKNIHFANEDAWDIKWKTYDELIKAYKIQDSLPMVVVEYAINNTNVLADMIEPFEVDRSFKYPQIYDKPNDVVQEKIRNGYELRGLGKKEDVFTYDERIEYELETYKKQDALNFLLLEENIKSAMAKEGVYSGYARGSASGSLIAYLLRIVETDSVKWNLYFERFMNPERVSLADIDTDYAPEDVPKVKDYIHNKMEGNLSTAEIITFNTNALKGSLKDISGGLEVLAKEGKLNKLGLTKDDFPDSKMVVNISKDIDEKLDEYKKKYPKFFKYVERGMGVVMSVGTHPAGTVISPINLDEYVGTFTTSTNPYPVTQLNMKEVDSLNFVKLDILGLDNVGIVNYACKLAGIDRLTPDNMDFSDDAVWDNMVKSPVGIFQFEGDYASSLLKSALSKETLEKAKKYYDGISRLDIMSIISAGLRPGGKSYINKLVNGEVNDNGHEGLNNLLGFTFGYLVFQESIIAFLNQFCGFTLGLADTIRRGFAKKTGTEQYIPSIKTGFIKTMTEQYDTDEMTAELLVEQFLQVIVDASDYVFSLNHAMPYSMLGYATAYLRTHYPLEFCTALLQYNQSNSDKTAKIVEYIESHTDVKIAPITFGKSRGEYFCDKGSNTIYKGIGSVKGIGSKAGDELFEVPISDSFFDLLDNILNTSVDSGQLTTLIQLDFFRKYGKSKYLLQVVEIWQSLHDAKVIAKGKYTEWEWSIKKHSRETEKQFRDLDTVAIMNDLVSKLDKEQDYSIKEKFKIQQDYLGYIDITYDIDQKYHIIKSIDKKFTPKVEVQSLSDGKAFVAKVGKKIWDDTIEVGDVIYIQRRKEKLGYFPPDDKGKFVVNPNKVEWHIEGYEKISDWQLEDVIGGKQ